MRICILSTGNTPIGFLDNDVPNALHFYDDKLHVYLTGTAHTLELSVIASDEAAELLAVGNKLAFYYEGRPYYLNIVSTSQTETEIEVEAWAYCLELLNENALVYEPTEAKTFLEYFKAMIYCNDMFEVGINEVSTAKRSTKYSSTSDTLLKRLYSLASDFDAELEFVPKLNGDYSLDTFEMNVYKEHSDTDQGVGEKRTDAYFRYGKDVDGITKTQDITELYTMIVPTGKDNLTIASIGERKVYDDDGMLLYDHPSGSEGIYAPLACQNFPSAVTSKDKYIRLDWSTDYETAESLYGNALAKLKEISTPESTYEIKGSIDVNIGDTITVIDEAFSPSLYLETRVTEQEICFTDPSKNSTTFSNTKELESQIDEALTKRVTELEKEAVETAAKAAEAAQAAQAASETATTAQTTAESAKTTAEGVEAIATEAKTTAESASTSAQAAQSAAESASTAASEAKTEAQSASSAASMAQSTAEAASTAASTAQSTAESAQTTANTASETATAAQTTANTANETATAAQTTATEAKAATDNLDTLIRATTDGVEVARIDSEGAYTGMRTEQTADAYLIKDKDGNTLASYGADTVELGKGNSDATIDMCDGTTTITSISETSQSETYYKSAMYFNDGFGTVGAKSDSESTAEATFCNSAVDAQIKIDVMTPEYTSGDESYRAAGAEFLVQAGPGGSFITAQADNIWLQPSSYSGSTSEGTVFAMSDVITALTKGKALSGYTDANLKTAISNGLNVTKYCSKVLSGKKPWSGYDSSNNMSIYLYRVGYAVFMLIVATLKIPVTGTSAISEYTIPSGYRPIANTYVPCVCGGTAAYAGVMNWVIYSSGAIGVESNSYTSANTVRYASGSWPTRNSFPS